MIDTHSQTNMCTQNTPAIIVAHPDIDFVFSQHTDHIEVAVPGCFAHFHSVIGLGLHQ